MGYASKQLPKPTVTVFIPSLLLAVVCVANHPPPSHPPTFFQSVYRVIFISLISQHTKVSCFFFFQKKGKVLSGRSSCNYGKVYIDLVFCVEEGPRACVQSDDQ